MPKKIFLKKNSFKSLKSFEKFIKYFLNILDNNKELREQYFIDEHTLFSYLPFAQKDIIVSFSKLLKEDIIPKIRLYGSYKVKLHYVPVNFKANNLIPEFSI